MEETKKVSSLLLKLQTRLESFTKLISLSWAGCSSEDSQENSDYHDKAYVFEPRIVVRTSKEARALILVLAREGCPEALYPLLISLQERFSKKKESVFQILNVAIQFLIDRRFSPESPTREAIEGILNYQRRSFLGNDLSKGFEILRKSELKIRALQRSKARKSGLPKRPKELAEPTHEWLPSWEKQYKSDPKHFEIEEDPIWELLSPTEVAFHFSRT